MYKEHLKAAHVRMTSPFLPTVPSRDVSPSIPYRSVSPSVVHQWSAGDP